MLDKAEASGISQRRMPEIMEAACKEARQKGLLSE